jgi:hypothetical protein
MDIFFCYNSINKYYRLPAVKSSGLHFKSDCLYTIIEWLLDCSRCLHDGYK